MTYSADDPPAAWAVPSHGFADLLVRGTWALPIPRWLIPDVLLRWVLPRLVKKNWPVFTRVVYHFPESEFAARRSADPSGFHRWVDRRVAELGWGT